jgi:hypothetical protein
VFVLAAITGVVYNFYNATQVNRLSTFDVTAGDEESDPIARAMGAAPHAESQEHDPKGMTRKFAGEFCPFCGAKVSPEFSFCPKCGKGLSQ